MSASRGYAYNLPDRQVYSDRRIWRLELRTRLAALSAYAHPRREQRRRDERAAGLRHIAEHPEMIQRSDGD